MLPESVQIPEIVKILSHYLSSNLGFGHRAAKPSAEIIRNQAQTSTKGALCHTAPAWLDPTELVITGACPPDDPCLMCDIYLW